MYPIFNFLFLLVIVIWIIASLLFLTYVLTHVGNCSNVFNSYFHFVLITFITLAIIYYLNNFLQSQGVVL